MKPAARKHGIQTMLKFCILSQEDLLSPSMINARYKKITGHSIQYLEFGYPSLKDMIEELPGVIISHEANKLSKKKYYVLSGSTEDLTFNEENLTESSKKNSDIVQEKKGLELYSVYSDLESTDHGLIDTNIHEPCTSSKNLEKSNTREEPFQDRDNEVSEELASAYLYSVKRKYLSPKEKKIQANMLEKGVLEVQCPNDTLLAVNLLSLEEVQEMFPERSDKDLKKGIRHFCAFENEKMCTKCSEPTNVEDINTSQLVPELIPENLIKDEKKKPALNASRNVNDVLFDMTLMNEAEQNFFTPTLEFNNEAEDHHLVKDYYKADFPDENFNSLNQLPSQLCDAETANIKGNYAVDLLNMASNFISGADGKRKFDCLEDSNVDQNKKFKVEGDCINKWECDQDYYGNYFAAEQSLWTDYN